jgi:anaerobic selenocysteine-containing dehydrogenase
VKVTRRSFLKGTAATGGILAASQIVGPAKLLPMADSAAPAAELVEDFVPTTCWIGKQDCGILARRINGRVVSLEGHPNHPRNRGTLCPKGIGQIQALYDPNRVKTPLIRLNDKGVEGEFREASWDEALGLVADKMNEVRERDPRLLIWQKGRSKAKKFYDDAFVKTTGATKLHHGAFCSDAGYRALEYTVGMHGVLHPDFRYTQYLISWGWNMTGAGGNKFCWLTWPQQFMDARNRGMKVIVIDPRLRGAGPHTDEWVPIRPGTDLMLALALCNLVIEQGTVDTDYLTRHSNAPFLVKSDGFFLRDADEKEQVWDTAAGAPAAFDAAGIQPALDGEFQADGEVVKTGYRLFKEQVAEYDVDTAADVCGISRESIQNIADDIAKYAMIGSTVVEDGVEVPLRPVGQMAYHVSQQEHGFQMMRALTMLGMLFGSVGAAGGTLSDFTWKVHKNYEGLDNIEITDSPNVYLNKSKFYPINSNNSSVVAQVMQNPAKYGVEYRPEVAILHMVNPITSFASEDDIRASYMPETGFKFVAVIDPWLSKSADLFADVVLPAATMEKYEGPLSATDQYEDAVTLRVPPMEPLFDSKGDIQIYLDLCEKADLLYGEGGYLDNVNQKLGLEEPYTLPLDRKPTEREIFDLWAKSEGVEEGVSFFEREGVLLKGKVSAAKRYGYATDPPFGGALHRIYGESLLRYQNEMKKKEVSQVYWQDYIPLPAWRTPTMEGSTSSGHDLYLISYKLIEFKQSRASQIPMLAELAPEQRLDINPRTAEDRGLANGDLAVVESHNALTGDTRSVTVKVHYTEGIRPDTVGMPHHYGEVANHPSAKGQGPTANALMFTGEGYTSNTSDQSFHVKVQVSKA